MKRLVLQSIVAISICVALFLLFTQIPAFKEKFNPQISIENEEKIGNALFDFYLKEEKKVSHPTLDSAIKKITYRLVNASGLSDYNYQFMVIKSEQINAFTLPGGRIVIFSGLIDITDAPEQLAAVLAHEIGHAEKKHVTQRLIKELGLTLILGVLTGADAGVLNEILHTATSTVFDRRQETEADDFGLELLEKAQINPHNMAIIYVCTNIYTHL